MKVHKSNNNAWSDDKHYLRGTATDTLILPQIIYCDGTNASLTIKGNTEQSGTPSSQNPIDIVGVGVIETSGEHAGDYKVPISNNLQTTNIYLGDTQTTRQIKKLVLDGTEEWIAAYDNTGLHVLAFVGYRRENALGTIIAACTHYITQANVNGPLEVNDMRQTFYNGSSLSNLLYVRDSNYTTVDTWKSYLAAQYANNTPVTIWYQLAEPETTTVNEPLQKIGNYADSLTPSISTADGANALSIDTTVQPSEVTANFHGWHPVNDIHERDSGAWS